MAYEERVRADWDLDERLTTIERYFALFEALNWAVSLDDRPSRDWPFEEIAFGKYWCDDFAGGGLIRGLRHARNAVHHDWSLALDIDPIESSVHLRMDLLGLAWSSERLADRDDDSAVAYDANLGDRVVGDTLLEISELLAAGTRIIGVLIAETGPRSSQGRIGNLAVAALIRSPRSLALPGRPKRSLPFSAGAAVGA